MPVCRTMMCALEPAVDGVAGPALDGADRAAEHGVALDHLDVEPVAGQVAGRDQRVVAAADHDDVPGCHPPEPTAGQGHGTVARTSPPRVERLGAHQLVAAAAPLLSTNAGATLVVGRPAPRSAAPSPPGQPHGRSPGRREPGDAAVAAVRRRAAGAAGRRPGRRPSSNGFHGDVRRAVPEAADGEPAGRAAVGAHLHRLAGRPGGRGDDPVQRCAARPAPGSDPAGMVSTTARPRAAPGPGSPTPARSPAPGRTGRARTPRSVAPARRAGCWWPPPCLPAGPAGARRARCGRRRAPAPRSGSRTTGSGPTCR